MADRAPDHHRAIFRAVKEAWGGAPKVIEMTAEGTPARQAILTLADHPRPGVTAFATIGLSDHCGAELVSLGASKNKSFIKAIFDVASYIQDGHRAAKVGACFEKALSHFYTRCEAGHLLLTDTPIPGLELPRPKVNGKLVKWLHAWPITSAECVLQEQQGAHALRKLLDGSVDLADLDRASFDGVPDSDPFAT